MIIIEDFQLGKSINHLFFWGEEVLLKNCNNYIWLLLKTFNLAKVSIIYFFGGKKYYWRIVIIIFDYYWRLSTLQKYQYIYIYFFFGGNNYYWIIAIIKFDYYWRLSTLQKYQSSFFFFFFFLREEVLLKNCNNYIWLLLKTFNSAKVSVC